MQQQHILAMVRLMTEKGYRGRFQVVPDLESLRRGDLRPLKECLSTWLSADHSDGGPGRPLFLSHSFFSGLLKENMDCRFEFTYSPDEGIGVSQMRLELGDNRENKVLQFRNNQEVPGFQSIEGKFNRRKPWDDQMRGRFPRH